MQSDTSPDITRIVLFVLVLSILLAGGPIVLAATYTLAKDWVARGQATEKVTE